ncbi:MAG TPA: thioredoxin domain-containing protein [Thermomicrobiales bacterium]|nr:thioredoxin domain-containing protein [Thermomicrobiales bacterium]
MPNRLALETSPYLLQHKDNPVDWYPWGPEALALARDRDIPILVSIGYSACHWCHVMAHESFENAEIAAYMNANFVNIKVDREERPEIDTIMMTAVQAMGGRGGWPLNAFLTPEGVPFYGGTYWPQSDRMGMPGFPRVLASVIDAWTTNRDGILDSADRVRSFLDDSNEAAPEPGVLSPELADVALANAERQFDREYGGFGGAPKFPQVSILEFLLRHHRRTGSGSALEMVLTTLDRMADGGINDQIGGGFARYSVDRIWLVPHFEKMLYDNAQLLSIYIDAFRITGNVRYRKVAEEIIGWLRREMMELPTSLFAASLDADSEGVEGKYYVWSEEAFERALAPSLDAEEIDLVKLHFGVTADGNFEGKNILAIVRPVATLAGQLGRETSAVEAVVERARNALLTSREERVAPGKDQKVVTAWNGLTLKALAAAGSVFQDAELLAVAGRCAGDILNHLRTDDRRLARSWRDGTLRGQGTLEDYAFLAEGLLELYAASGSVQWLDAAGELVDRIVASFVHPTGAGFYDTADDHEDLITRPRTLQDGATPSGNAVACELLLTFGMLRNDDRLLDLAERTLASLARPMREQPVFMGRHLAVLERWLSPRRDLVLAGEPTSAEFIALRAEFRQRYEPHVVLGYGNPEAEQRYPLLADRPAKGNAAAYLCEHFTCLPPVTSPEALRDLLDAPT